jgi:hypothetical protein
MPVDDTIARIIRGLVNRFLGKRERSSEPTG